MILGSISDWSSQQRRDQSGVGSNSISNKRFLVQTFCGGLYSKPNLRRTFDGGSGSICNKIFSVRTFSGRLNDSKTPKIEIRHFMSKKCNSSATSSYSPTWHCSLWSYRRILECEFQVGVTGNRLLPCNASSPFDGLGVPVFPSLHFGFLFLLGSCWLWQKRVSAQVRWSESANSLSDFVEVL